MVGRAVRVQIKERNVAGFGDVTTGCLIKLHRLKLCHPALTAACLWEDRLLSSAEHDHTSQNGYDAFPALLPDMRPGIFPIFEGNVFRI